MKEGTAEMHIQALQEMVEYYQKRDDRESLREQLLLFYVLLQRAEMLPALEIEEVLRSMQLYDELIENDPYLRSLAQRLADKLAREMADKMAQERADKLAQGMIKHIQGTIKHIIEARFPSLLKDLTYKIILPEDQEALETLLVQVAVAPDEKAACKLLGLQDN